MIFHYRKDDPIEARVARAKIIFSIWQKKYCHELSIINYELSITNAFPSITLVLATKGKRERDIGVPLWVGMTPMSLSLLNQNFPKTNY